MVQAKRDQQTVQSHVDPGTDIRGHHHGRDAPHPIGKHIPHERDQQADRDGEGNRQDGDRLLPAEEGKGQRQL
ncbi:hypothetical protein D3C76_1661780 [compost metagenome]